MRSGGKNSKLRYLEYYGLQGALDNLYAESKSGKVFTNLMQLIASDDNIMLAYRNIKRNRGSKTAGVDGDTIRSIEKMSESEVIRVIQAKLQWYQPKAVKRVEIPKADGRTRPLGIPAMWDRLIQQCILQVLEPICEAKFHERSNGFRPNRSAETAMAQCCHMIQVSQLHFVVDIDIKGFFDNVNHTKLIQQMWAMGIQDKKLICIIKAMLKAPVVLTNGSITHPERGTPQGGILSPLLSNIVLNELDWWVSSQWESMPTHRVKDVPLPNGGANHGHKYRSLRLGKLKEMQIVRYADDFKIFCRKRTDAQIVYAATKQWLQERLKLEINEEKSSICNLKKRYSDFLGFRLKATPRRKSYVARTRMCEKAVVRTTAKLKDQIKKIARPQNVDDERLMVNQYNYMVRGIHEYFQIATEICRDCRKIGWVASIVIKNRLGEKVKKEGEYGKGYSDIKKRYGSSAQMRFIHDRPIVPVGYPKPRIPLAKKRLVNKYTPEGRAEIHAKLELNTGILEALRREPKSNRSIEYMDNRISRYCGQTGKCAVMGTPLEYGEMHCHHVLPKRFGGKDDYANLVWVDVRVHRLLHATVEKTIRRYMDELRPDPSQLKKLNKFRKRAQLSPVVA